MVSWTLWCFKLCVNSAVVISFDTLQFSAAIFDMVSKICCCNGVATHTGFLDFLNPVFIPSFILFVKTNRGRMVCFYVLYWCWYTLVLSSLIMI